ncbi:MAG TPA: hypothetical protein VHF51_16640, partial [Solirubrobacteraceae bacterium]|nr:hypothetical protein [Solirubrobacteraceae bacterium]
MAAAAPAASGPGGGAENRRGQRADRKDRSHAGDQRRRHGQGTANDGAGHRSRGCPFSRLRLPADLSRFSGVQVR